MSSKAYLGKVLKSDVTYTADASIEWPVTYEGKDWLIVDIDSPSGTATVAFQQASYDGAWEAVAPTATVVIGTVTRYVFDSLDLFPLMRSNLTAVTDFEVTAFQVTQGY